MAQQKQLHDEIDEMIQTCGDLYRKLDIDNSGTVTTAELTKELRMKKSNAKGRQVELYQELIDHVSVLDKNHDGKISFVEFTLACDKLKSKYCK